MTANLTITPVSEVEIIFKTNLKTTESQKRQPNNLRQFKETKCNEAIIITIVL